MPLTLLLPLLAFLLLFLLLAGEARGDGASEGEGAPDWQIICLQAAVLWGALLALLTYGLSFFGALDWPGVSLGWGAAVAILAVWGRRSGRSARGWAQARRWVGSLARLRALPKAEAVFLAVVALLALASLAVALMAPPNTNDSMRYHMARVMHWQQNRSLAHYSTPVEAQLYMPPWAELAILNLVVLAGSDRLANLPQWLAMLGSLVGVGWIARRLGAGAVGQVFAVVFAFTLPMGILQSTSTQNDYVAAWWAVCLAVFTLRDLQGKPSAWLMGLSTALGVLSKGSFYPYAIAFLGAWGAAALARLARGWRGGGSSGFRPRELLRILRYAVSVVVCLLALNGGFWQQNLRTYGSPLGPAEALRNHANQSFTPAAVASNLVRNVTLHLGTPWGEVNGWIKNGVVQLHTWLGQDVNDPLTTMNRFRVKRYLNEDRAGNTWHLLGAPGLAVLAWGWQRWRRRAGKAPAAGLTSPGSAAAGGYAVLMLVVFLLFSILYKWQDTGSRLQLPWFVLLAPAAGVCYERLAGLRAWKLGVQEGIAFAFLALALPFVFMNPSRPCFAFGEDTHTIWNTPRQTLVFRNFPEVQEGYQSLALALAQTGCRQVGLHLDSSDPEYYLWALTADLEPPVRFEHLLEDRPVAGFTPCAAICTRCTAEEMDGLPLHSAHPGGLRLDALNIVLSTRPCKTFQYEREVRKGAQSRKGRISPLFYSPITQSARRSAGR